MPKVAPLTGYLGLDNKGVPRVSQHVRVRMTIYPLDILFGSKKVIQTKGYVGAEGPVQEERVIATSEDWFLEKRDPGKKMVFDWTSESDAGLMLFDYNKQMGQPSGTWMAVIKEKPGKDLGLKEGRITDGDWCDVTILRNGVEIPLCRGVIDSVREQTASSGGATVRTWQLAGKDHGAFFEYPITYQNIWAQTLGELVAGLFTARVKGKIGGRPDEMFQILIDATFSMGKLSGQWELPSCLGDTVGGKKRLHELLDIVTYSAEKLALGAAGLTPNPPGLRGAYYNEPQLWTAGGQTLHQTLMQWCNPLLNEVYYDLIPPVGFTPANGTGGWVLPLEEDTEVEIKERENLLGGTLTAAGPAAPLGGTFGTIAAFIRERPFPSTIMGNDSLWFDLPEWKIPRWAVQTTDLGRGGHERYNLFELLADLGSMGTTTEQPPICPPSWNKMDIRQRGLRVFSQTTRYLAQLKQGMGDWHRERETWQDLLRDWHAPAPYLRQGTVPVKLLLPEIRLGQKLVIDEGGAEEDNERLYVEGVHLRYMGPQGSKKPPTGVSTFILTHGFRGTDKKYLDSVKNIAADFTRVL